MTDAPSRLDRRLGVGDAVVIGLGSMIGAGVFAAIGPAAAAAGVGLLVGLAVAGAVATCNAASSAVLAATYPTSGGAYVYGRVRLGPWWGFVAGWGFVVGKTASCAAIALTFGAYVAPDRQRLLAAAAVVALTVVNLLGVRKTVQLTRVIVVVVLAALALVVAGALGATDGAGHLGDLGPGGVGGTLRSAGLLFFAFAGYARIATLGEEVRDPARTIPRAVGLALVITLVVYGVVAVSALAAVGPEALARSAAPLATVAGAGAHDELVAVVRVGGAVACLGVLLSLLAGVTRTAFAMAADRELPSWLAAVDPVHRVPHRAQLAAAALVLVLVATTDLRGVIGFSSCCVLVYYAIANAAAWTLPPDRRRWRRPLAACGLVGCATLAVTLPPEAIVTASVVLAVGLLGRGAAVRRAAGPVGA